MLIKESNQTGKLTDEQLGVLSRKLGDIIKGINSNTISYQDAVDVMQNIIIEGQSQSHLRVVKKICEIKLAHSIDCDVPPFIPPEFTLKEHQLGGQYLFDPDNLSCFTPELPRGVTSIIGNDLREELKGRSIFNANILDYLLAHTYLIPDDWKNKCVCFFGTSYIFAGQSCIRCLIWNNSKWDWDCRFFNSGFRFSQSNHSDLVILAN